MEAKNKEDWWKKVRADHHEWNAKAHSEDRISFNEWLDERIGDTIYGYKIIEDDNSNSGISIVKVTKLKRI